MGASLAENRQRTILEIKTDQTQAEIDIKRLQDMVDRLQQSASRIGFGGAGGAGGGGAGGGGGGTGAAPPPPATGRGAAGGAGGGAPAPPPSGRGAGGGPGGAPGPGGGAGGGGGPGGGGPGVGPGLGGGPGGSRGGGGAGAGARGAGAGRAALGGLARAAGPVAAAAMAANMIGTGIEAYYLPSGYTGRGLQAGLGVASKIPFIGRYAAMARKGIEKYGQEAHQLGNLMVEEGAVGHGGIDIGLQAVHGTNYGGTDYMGRSFGTPIDTTARDWINYGWNAQQRIQMAKQVQQAAGVGLRDYNLAGMGRMRRGGLEAGTVGQFIRGREEYGLRNIGGDAVDAMGRKGIGGVEGLAVELQSQGYRGIALNSMMQEHAQALQGAGRRGLVRDLGDYTQQLSDLQRAGVQGRKAVGMANQTADTVGGVVTGLLDPYKQAGIARLRAGAARGTSSMFEQIQKLEKMTTGDVVSEVQRGQGGDESKGLMLKAMFPELEAEEGSRLARGFQKGAGTRAAPGERMDIAGGWSAQRIAARGELGVFRAIDKSDIKGLIQALHANREATIETGKTMLKMFSWAS